jgi:hypothetical protein
VGYQLSGKLAQGIPGSKPAYRLYACGRTSPRPESLIFAAHQTRLPTIAPAPATAASTTSSAAAAISTIAASAGTALSLRTRFINIERAPAQLRSVQCRDGFLSVFVARHLNESETTRTSRLAICKNAHTIDLSVGLEQLTQFIFRRVERQIPNENVLQASCLSVSYLSVG